MNIEQNFHSLSFWALFLLTVLIVLVAVEAGFRYGDFRRKKKKQEEDKSIGTLVAAMLGLLAFIMAFTFGMSGSYFEARRMVVLKESNAIGTAYLRADFIPEPERTQVRSLLREYADVRIDALIRGRLKEAIERSEKLLDDLWCRVSAVSGKSSPTPLTGLFVQAINDVIDIHSERLLEGVHKYIPTVIWAVLYCVTFFSMLAVGYQFGLNGIRNKFAAFVLALTFSAVMVLIADLDNPRKGMIKTSQWSMLELQKKLNVGADSPHAK
jgi:hypothetical protein